MTMFEMESSPARAARTTAVLSEIDAALVAQIVVAWAGESGEYKRLGWWSSDLVSEYGGRDLFKRLLPHTQLWAVLQGAREAARRRDAELRRQNHDADRVLSLFSLGFELDERLEERLQELKRAGRAPADALPGLAAGGLELDWSRDSFLEWVRSHGEPAVATTSVGRRLKREAPTRLDHLTHALVSALAPLADTYPLPYFTRPA
jgi:hypothetical protein